MDRHVFLGHGASGTAASMAPYVQSLGARGIAATAIDLPKRKAEDAVPALLGLVPAGSATVAGGHSYGGRVASLAAATTAFGGLVLISYPLHRPGAPEIGPRVGHWPSIACPVLLLSGEADQFARIELLREAVKLLPSAELVTYPGVRHGLLSRLDDVADRIAAFVRGLPDAG